MEKLISLIFSNLFVIIFVVAGVSNFVKKIKGNDFKPGSDGKTQKRLGDPSKNYKWENVFDFDLQKWIEVQSGQQQGEQKELQNRTKQTIQVETNPRDLSDFRTSGLQISSSNAGRNVAINSTLSGINIVPIEVETEKQFEFDMSDMQKAVVMAEILGPPRSKRKSVRY